MLVNKNVLLESAYECDNIDSTKDHGIRYTVNKPDKLPYLQPIFIDINKSKIRKHIYEKSSNDCK